MPTLADIARKAGVSGNLVSYVLKKTTPPKSEKHKRILEIAKEMNYVPNRIASALSTGRTDNITLICGPNFRSIASELFFTDFLDTLTLSLTARGMGLSIYNSASEETLAKVILNGTSDAVIWYLTSVPGSIKKLVTERNIPFLLLISEDAELDWISFDNFSAEYRLISEIYGMGHRKIAFVQSGNSISHRTLAYMKFMSDSGLEHHVINLQSDINDTRKLKSELIPQLNHCTALAAEKDTLALRICDCLADAGYLIPDDISIAGFDDIPEAADANVPLTTVRQDIGILTEKAMEFLTKRISGENVHLQHLINHDPIIRKSVKIIE